MPKRNIRIQLWLNEKEAERFNRHVERSGLPREIYLRQLINGLMPTDAPPPDYFAMMKELHYIGVNLNQIARKAHALNVLDVKRYDENITAFFGVTGLRNTVETVRQWENGTMFQTPFGVTGLRNGVCSAKPPALRCVSNPFRGSRVAQPENRCSLPKRSFKGFKPLSG